MIRIISRLLLALIILLSPIISSAWTGKVVSVTDGDTAKIVRSDASIQIKVRFAGIDAPEKKQAYGQKARKFVVGLIAGRTVDVEEVTTDRYGRTVGYLWLGNKEINLEIVKEGYAWVYRKYAPKPSSRADQYFTAEKTARSSSTGLWHDPHPIAPWEWRHNK